ncbi:hybrid sensor histidine kinase/response regulator transcription factor [Flavobacterium sp. HNIBRBA15423]|uniref:hybrid sensor histidine kinase/response regulator transcription factor n=1 Tax=Flavobacterium sp. HNIBRBA15423 TaxID=3458683 RepID=UPI004044895C
MSKKEIKYLVIFLLTLVNLLFSQNKFENYQFRSIKEATSKRAISTIIKDQYGFIWIGTNGAGLFKYDGFNYIGYEYDAKNEGSINSNLIYSMHVDTHNNLWVGTDEGLCKYNRDLDSFVKINIEEVIAKGYNEPITVKSIIEDNNGNLILGTFGYGILKVNLKTLQTTQIRNGLLAKNDSQINYLAKKKNGTIYIASNYGLLSLDANDKVVQVYKDKFKKKPIYETIETLVVDKQGYLWLGSTSDGLIKMKPDNDNYQFEVFPITTNKILSIIESNLNFIICGTENHGLIIVNYNGEVQQKYLHSKYNNNSLKSNSVWSLYEDEEDRIWLGYYNKGFGVFDKPNAKFKAVESILNNENSLQTSSVTSVVKDKSGKLLISSEGGGIDIFNPVDKTFIQVNKKNQNYYSGLDANDVQTIFIDSKQNIWVGSWNQGVYFLKNGTNAFVNYNVSNTPTLKSNRIFCFTEDSKGRIWIGTFIKGLHYYDPIQNQFFHCESKSFVESELDLSYIRKLLVDSDDVLWVGTILGLYEVSLKQESEFQVKSMKNLMMKDLKKHNSIHTILSLYESNDKTIWVGTDGAGLFSYNKKNNTFSNYTDFPGLKEKSVRAIIADDHDYLWISGGSGITKLDIKNKTSINFTVEDGLLSNEFSNNAVFKGNNGELYFGNYEGMNYFDPNQVTKAEKEPLLYFSDFKLFNKSVTPNEDESPLTKVITETNHVTLKHSQSVFTIEYAGIDYNNSRKNEYAYYLEGFEENWNYVGNNRSATYTNLEPGEYTFKLKSGNRAGSWNEKPLELKITVLPPWWKTSYAYVVYFILTGLFSFYIVRFYQNRFKAKQAIILEREKTIQIEKLNNKKLQFFTNISHEFRTPLTLIINPLEDILKNKRQELSSTVYNKLKTIHKSSDRLSRLINELMDFNKLKFNTISLQVSKFEVIGFVKEIISYFDEEALVRNITVSFECSEETLEDWLDPKMFEKIIFNIISNAFKFTPDGGTIIVTIKKQELTQDTFLLNAETQKVSTYSIAIEDTGSGLDNKDLKRIFDRFYQVNNLNKAYYGSTGIGLEVVKEFVELHKGKIDVESMLGVGTKFTVTFPIGKEYFEENQICKEPFEKRSLKRKFQTESFEEINNVEIDEVEIKKEHTILIVEDNSELRNYLKSELKKQYKIIVAENGKKGYELAVSKLPDLIITDVIMPVMNGLDFCKKVKTNIKTSHIPLLMLSAKAMVKDRLEGIDSGADIYLSKPFDMDILKSSLAQLITSRQIIFNKLYTGITKQGKEKTTTLDLEFIQKILNLINENISESQLNVELLSSKVFLSRSQLYRKIKTLTGVSVNEFIRNVRLEKAKYLIEQGDNNINEISYKVGFTSPSYFTKCYKVKYGHLPTQEKNFRD